MRLTDFIAKHLDDILADWVAFARQQQPAAAAMDERALLDHARLILEEIVADMGRPQAEHERQAKSEGADVDGPTPHLLPSRSHARERERQGFLIAQMIGEYRALRATVLRLWAASPGAPRIEDLEDVMRFNEAVDQAIAESVEVFVVEVDKARELFLGVLSHDLRGPLSAISASAALLARLHPQEARPVQVILRSVTHMTALLDDLRAYTRERLSGSFPVEVGPLQLDEFVRQTLDEIDIVANGRAMELQAAGDMRGEWDAQRLHQALSNLIFNALKYGAAKTPIGIALDGTQESEVVVSVHNQGRRIPEDMLDKVFDPLVRANDGEGRTDAQPTGANLGLGLYVVRQVARAHGGGIDVASDDTGTRFTLRLPRFTGRREAAT